MNGNKFNYFFNFRKIKFKKKGQILKTNMGNNTILEMNHKNIKNFMIIIIILPKLMLNTKLKVNL